MTVEATLKCRQCRVDARGTVDDDTGDLMGIECPECKVTMKGAGVDEYYRRLQEYARDKLLYEKGLDLFDLPKELKPKGMAKTKLIRKPVDPGGSFIVD